MSEIAAPSQLDVSFALVGAGSVGGGVFHQSLITPGVRCDVVCDLSVERALSLRASNRPSTLVDTPGALADAVRRGELAVCQDAMLAATAAGVDVLFDVPRRSTPRRPSSTPLWQRASTW